MSEETNIQCPACTAELPPETVECPWCGHLMTPRVEDVLLAELAQAEKEHLEPEAAQPPTESEPASLPEETEPEAPLPDATVFVVEEPGLTEFAPAPVVSPSGSLKVMGIVLIIFSFLALVFFIFQVFQGKLPQIVLALPVFGMLIGFISVAVAQRR